MLSSVILFSFWPRPSCGFDAPFLSLDDMDALRVRPFRGVEDVDAVEVVDVVESVDFVRCKLPVLQNFWWFERSALKQAMLQ